MITPPSYKLRRTLMTLPVHDDQLAGRRSDFALSQPRPVFHRAGNLLRRVTERSLLSEHRCTLDQVRLASLTQRSRNG